MADIASPNVNQEKFLENKNYAKISKFGKKIDMTEKN